MNGIFSKDIKAKGMDMTATPLRDADKESGVFDNVTPFRPRDGFRPGDDTSEGMMATPMYRAERTQSAIFSEAEYGCLKMEGDEIDARVDRKSAAFGSVSSVGRPGSQQDFIGQSQANFGVMTPVEKEGEEIVHELVVEPEMDQSGQSGDSNVIDHSPFKDIQEAMTDQDRVKGQIKAPSDSESSEK